MKALREQWAGCDRCKLAEVRNRVVFGSGSPKAKLGVIGEAPGAGEDEQGVPFVGQSGQLLNWGFKTAGVVRRAAFVFNLLACRPPDNRDPEPDELEACQPRIQSILTTVQPRCLLITGKQAAQHLLQRRVAITYERGNQGWLEIPEMAMGGVQYVLTLHPAYILRQPSDNLYQKLRANFASDIRKAWEIASLGSSLR